MPKSTKDIKCFHYNRVGHMKKECRFPWNEQSQESKDENETNIVARKGDVSIIYDDSCINLVSHKSNQVTDSGASFRVTLL